MASLLAGATVWGLIWYPYRVLESLAVPAVLGTTLTYLVALLAGLALLGRPALQCRPDWRLALIALAAGGCNLGYVLAMVQSQVMRVLLLFYLAPLWTVLLARILLHEKVSFPGAAVIALSLAGAFTMLWQPRLGRPWPASAAEWLGLAAGFFFALANVLVRQMQDISIELKSLAVLAGVVLLGGLALPFAAGRLPLPSAAAWLLVVLVGLVLLATNLFVQFGLTHTPANRAIVLFLFELVVAAVSSWLLAGEHLRLQEWLGGSMIVVATVFSGRLEARQEKPS